jgi:hypothetical protein
MTWSLIVRMYQTKDRARDAVTKLKDAGFRDDSILELTPGSAQSVASAILAGQMMGHRAGFYAERVRNGRSLVAIDAPFGKGQLATEIMDGCGPVDQDLKVPEDTVRTKWGKAAPLSEALGLRVLLRDQPSPLSDALRIRTKARREYYLTSELASRNPAPLSSMLGLRVLSRDPTPLSSMLNLPVLSRWAKKSSSFGVKLLSRDPAPLSSALGIRTLSRDPTPLSSAVDMDVLARPDRSPPS